MICFKTGISESVDSTFLLRPTLDKHSYILNLNYYIFFSMAVDLVMRP